VKRGTRGFPPHLSGPTVFTEYNRPHNYLKRNVCHANMRERRSQRIAWGIRKQANGPLDVAVQETEHFRSYFPIRRLKCHAFCSFLHTPAVLMLVYFRYKCAVAKLFTQCTSNTATCTRQSSAEDVWEDTGIASVPDRDEWSASRPALFKQQYPLGSRVHTQALLLQRNKLRSAGYGLDGRGIAV
jgi:hypothetical protein